MEELVTLTIDGKEVKVKRGATILEAAEKAGIYIPTLCHHPDLTPFGACRLCIVEVEGMRGFPPACATPVADGMVVRTNTPRIQELRRNILELILSEHPYNCLTCPKNLDCELQRVARYIGIDQVSLPPIYKNLPVIRDNPFFDRDYNLCILCGRCVRMCEEVRGVGAISFVFRGIRAVVGTAFDQPLQDVGCEFCGACVDACPTGALVQRSWRGVGLPDREVLTVCPYCGAGCQLRLVVKDERVIGAKPAREGVNKGQLCVKGKFGLDFIHSPERLTAPLIRKNGELVPVSWEEALDFIATRLPLYRGDGFAFLASAKCTNEENYLFQKFVRAVMGTNNIDHCARLCHAPTVVGLVMAFGSGAMTNSIDEIKDASTIFVIGSNTTEAHPVIGLRIKEAVRKGAKLIVANPRKIDLVRFSHMWLRQRPGTDVPLLLAMAKTIIDEGLVDEDFIKERCEGFEEFTESLKGFDMDEASRITGVPIEDIREAARIYAKNKPSTIIYSMGITQHSHGTDNVLAIANLALLTGNVGKPSTGVNPLRGQNNVQGACDMGALPNVFPGYQRVDVEDVRSKFEKAWGKKLPEKPGLTVVEMINGILEGKIKAMYIVGENPMLSDPDINHVREALSKLQFLVVQDIFLSETARLAHVVLPAACFAEKDGTFTNTERRVQLVRKAVNPPGEAKADWEIICELAKRMGEDGFDYKNTAEIMEEIRSLTPIYGGITHTRLENGGIMWPCPSLDHPGTLYLHKDGFTRGKGKFHALSYKPPAELPDDEYPFILTTGRSLYHFHTGTMTRKVEGLNVIKGEGEVEINPEDGERLGIKDGDMVWVVSRRGKVRARARLTERSAKGVVFMNFHFYESCANFLTNPALDPVAKIPEYKVCAVSIRKEE